MLSPEVSCRDATAEHSQFLKKVELSSHKQQKIFTKAQIFRHIDKYTNAFQQYFRNNNFIKRKDNLDIVERKNFYRNWYQILMCFKLFLVLIRPPYSIKTEFSWFEAKKSKKWHHETAISIQSKINFRKWKIERRLTFYLILSVVVKLYSPSIHNFITMFSLT